MNHEEFHRRLDEIKDLPPLDKRYQAEMLDEEVEEECYAGGAINVFDLDRIRREIYEATGYRYE